ncbi:MAG TPA: hypothetical protein VKQ71_13055 [Acidimicrobiales bacterium]|nr:hypothetical protein [Acidimicrobiales bacterium]
MRQDQGDVLKDLRAARRRRRTAEFDPFEALYRAYVTGICLAVAVLVLSSVTGDTKLSVGEIADVRHHGGPIVGLAFALIFAVGLRSGGRGGPLVIEAADVRHVLLAPVDRTFALRGPAIRQARFGALLGGGAGAIAGLLALRRLPGSPAAWVACGAAAGAAAAVGALGLAMVVAGLRLGRWVGGTAALAVLAWSGVDVATRTVTSPASLLGQFALWPLTVRPLDLAGVVLAVVVFGAGLTVLGGSALEASERRASLVGQIRFAATLQDLRTVIVLRRQLAQELPRQRPWVRLPRSVPRAWLGSPPVLASPAGDGAGGDERSRPSPRRRRLPVWRRGWHGILRWPALRFARVLVLGAGAGLALVGVWRGTTPLVVVAGLALYVAALDAVEPLAQEVDHPDRRDGYHLPAGQLHFRQLGPPALLMLVVAGVGVAAGVIATGGSSIAAEVGAVLVLPAAFAALGGAAVSVLKGPPPPLSPQQALMPEAAGARAMGRLLWPPIIAVIGVLPVLGGRNAWRHHQPILVGLSTGLQPVIFLVIGVIVWVRFQEEAHVWFARQMDTAKTGAAGGQDRSQ